MKFTQIDYYAVNMRPLKSSGKKKQNIASATYGSSGVRWTGSSVNSGGKFAKSRSESKRGLYGGVTCFCSSYNAKSDDVVKCRNASCRALSHICTIIRKIR